MFPTSLLGMPNSNDFGQSMILYIITRVYNVRKSAEKYMLITMMSTSLRLQGDIRGLAMGLRQLTMNSGNLSAVNLAASSNRQFSAAARPVEIPKRPNTPWVNFFKANLPEHRKKNPGAKVSDLMSKIGEEWRKLPAQKKVKS